MPPRLLKQAAWIKRLLPACDGDVSLAKRQLIWLKEKIQADRSEPSDAPLTPKEEQQLEDYIRQRVDLHKPLQYILGTQPFCELDIITRPPVLIPRWETEEWASRLCEVIRSNWQPSAGSLRILDVCTGTGCIALTLASQLPENSVEICALDISSDAIVLARENYAVHASRIQNQVQFHLCDIYDEPLPVTGDFDCVIANPPYITGQEYSDLDADVKQWEDKRALYAAENGTAVHRRIIDVASRLTQPKWNIPRVIMEIGGSHQIESLAATLKSHHFTDIEVWQDLAGKDRVILAK